MKRGLLVEHGFFRRSVLGPVLMALRWMGLFPAASAAWLLVRGQLPYSLINRWVRLPTDRGRTWLACLLSAIPAQTPFRSFSPRAMTGLVFLLSYLPDSLEDGRDRCIQELAKRNAAAAFSLLSSPSAGNGLSLVGPLVEAVLFARPDDGPHLLNVQSTLFKQLRANFCRDDYSWDKDSRRTMFVGAGLVFAEQVAPALYKLLEARSFPSDLASIRLLVFCRSRLSQVKSVTDDRGVTGIHWQANYAHFMDWSQAYLNRARMSPVSGSSPLPAARRM